MDKDVQQLFCHEKLSCYNSICSFPSCPTDPGFVVPRGTTVLGVMLQKYNHSGGLTIRIIDYTTPPHPPELLT